MTQLRFRPEVAADVREAYQWYDERSGTAATGYLDQLEALFERIRANPVQFPVVYREIRRALARRYPYAVYFVLDSDAAVVLGVLHQAVHPRAWQDRE